MTVETTTNRAQYATNGTTGPWTVPFYFLDDAHLEVICTDASGNETTLALTTNYSVTGAGVPAGGTVTTVTAYAAGGYVTILRRVPALQQTDYVDGDRFPAATHERALDLLTMIVQQQAEVIARALIFAPSDTAGSQLPAVSVRAGKLLGFNSLGILTMSAPASGSAADLALSLASTANPSVGPGLIGWLRAATGAVATTLYRLLGWRAHNPLEFMSDAQRADVEAGTALLDVSAAINAAITAAGSGGSVELPPYPMLCTSPILAEGKRGITIRGAKGQYGWAGSRLICKHTGKAGLSLVGSLFCRLDGFTIEGDTASRPVTGLLLGRSSAASAGNHTMVDVNVQGYFQEIGTAIVASEENTWINCYLVPTAARVAGVLISPADGQTLNGVVTTIGGLTSSSMECNTFIGGTIGNADNTAGTTGLYIDCNAATGHHHFHGSFFTKNGGDSFIFIRLGAIDGLDSEFPIGFHDCSGEEGAAKPTTGLHFSAGTTRILSGFTAENLRFQTPATNNILCDGGGSVYMIAPRITTPYRAAGTKPSTFHRIDAGELSLLSESAITITQMVGTSLVHNTAGPTITTSTSNEIRSLGGEVSSRFGELTGFAVYDPGNLVDGAGVTTTVAVTGAALGDYAMASFSNALQGITVSAWVSATDTVSVRLQNESGGALDLAGGTLRAKVIKA